MGGETTFADVLAGRAVSVSTDDASDEVARFNPVLEFKYQLRCLHEKAENPTLETMARRGGGSTGGLSGTLRGDKLPTAEATRKLLLGCEIVDEEALKVWEDRRRAGEAAAKRLLPNLDCCVSMLQLQEMLGCLLASQHIDSATLVRRMKALGQVLPAATAGELLAGTRTLDRRMLELAVRAAGGTDIHVTSWQCCYDRIRSPVETSSPATSTPGHGGVSPTINQPADGSASSRRRPRIFAARVAVSTAAVMLILVGCGWIILRSRHGGRLAAAPLSAERPPPTHPDAAPAAASASDKLLAMSRHVRTLHEKVTTGPYTYIHRKLWTSRPGAEPGSEDVDLDDVRLWWSPSGSGHRIETRTPAHQQYPEPPDDVQFTSDDLHIPIPEPSSDPDRLAVQLDAEEGGATGAGAVMRAIDTMNDWHHLDAAQRAAVLELLAQTPGISYRGQFIDLESRSGVAFSADTDNGSSVTRDTLSFDASNGALLAHEATITPDGGAAAALGLTQNVHLERGASGTDN